MPRWILERGRRRDVHGLSSGAGVGSDGCYELRHVRAVWGGHIQQRAGGDLLRALPGWHIQQRHG